MSNRSLHTFHQPMNSSSAKWILAGAAITLSAAVLPSAALAQSNQAPLPTTVCAYNPEGGQPNPLGMRAFIRVSEVDGNSVFVYEQFPSPLSGLATADSPATIARERTLTLFDTPIAEARQRVVDNPAYYAELTGATVEQVGENGFGEVNETLTCQDITAANPPATTPTPGTPTPGTPVPPTATPPITPSTTFADLPNGNYRVASADLPFRVIETAELLESGANVYLFRKTGSNVVGNFFTPETDISICVSGTIAGNVVSGEAEGPGVDSEGTIPDSDALTLPEGSSDGRFEEATLNLAGFSRINAGTELPPESCG